MNSALITMTIMPMLFGFMPSIVVTIVCLPIFAFFVFVVYLISRSYHPAMLILGCM
jgi:archaellum biogenesis protein FlaJ (TadC family)